jgi:LysM repeat protein
LTLPLVRQVVDGAIAGLLLTRAASGWLAPGAALAEAQPIEVRIVDSQAAPVHQLGELPEHDLVYLVESGDSLARIAERYYGDWKAYELIFQANRERQQPDGRSLGNAGAIYPGWKLVIPGPTQGIEWDPMGQSWCVVQPGDNLSELAAQLLGDPTRWQEIFELNKGVARLADGRTLTNPDLVWPGLHLRLPGSSLADPAPPVAGTTDEPASVSIPADADSLKISTLDPAQAVVSYYRLLDRGNVSDAAELMHDGPHAWLKTHDGERPLGRLAVQRVEVVSMDAHKQQAEVAVEIEETTSQPGTTLRHSGTWRLSRGPSGWLLETSDIRVE